MTIHIILLIVNILLMFYWTNRLATYNKSRGWDGFWLGFVVANIVDIIVKLAKNVT